MNSKHVGLPVGNQGLASVAAVGGSDGETRADQRKSTPVSGSGLSIKVREDLPELFNHLGFTGHGIEVGVQSGKFSTVLRSGWKFGTLHLVDRWHYDPSYEDIANVDEGKQEELFRQVTALFAGQANVKLHRLDSLEAARQFGDDFFDWVYLDADHSFYGVLADLAAWYPKVRSGGILAGHDFFDGQYPSGDFGVRSAVKQFMRDKDGELRVTNEPGISRTWYFRKPAQPPAGVVSRTPSVSADEYLASASDAYARGDLWGARDDLAELVLDKPGFLAAVATLGSVEFQLHNYGTSFQLLHRAVALSPNDPTLLVQLATAALRVGQGTIFEVSLKQALTLDPRNLPALTLLAKTHFEAEHFAQAAPVYDLIRKLSPGDLNVLRCLGKCLLMTGDAKGAVSVYQEALRLAPTDEIITSGLRAARSRLPSGQG